MITAVPLPRWSALGARSRALPGDEALAAPWRRPGDVAFWFSRGAWALRALADAWAGQQGMPPSVWLPDYFCNGSTAPLRMAGIRIVFYPVRRDLAPRIHFARAMVAEVGAPDLFVLVHYFGRPNPGTGQAVAFCHEMNALLVEDAAHVLRPWGGIGDHGQAVFYSPHKLLAVPDGAVLSVREPLAEALAQARLALPETPPPTGSWLARRMVQKTPLGSPLARLARRRPGFLDDPSYCEIPETPALSPFARALLAAEIRRLDAVAAARRANAARILAALGDRADPLTGPEDDAPYRLVLRYDAEEAAAMAFARLSGRGALVETWPDLPPEVKGDPARHEDALALRRNVLLLPVHQTLDVRALLRRLG